MPSKRKASGQDVELGRSKRLLPERVYGYETLLPWEIRLLILCPGRQEDPLCGALETVCLQDKPTYKAISYAWGEPVFSERINLSRRTMHITTSLCGALRRFRSETEPVRLWADAISINQLGHQEKNHQVSVMADIYRQAEEVLVWLGAAQPSDCLASWMLGFTVDYGREHSYHYEKGLYSTIGPLSEAFERRRVADQGWIKCPSCENQFRRRFPSLEEAFTALATVWSRDWFGRLWVLQEVSLAKSVKFFFGNHVKRMETMDLASHVHSSHVRHCSTIVSAGPQARETVNRAHTLFGGILFSDGREDLLDYIMKSSQFSCSEPRDRVFAITALANIKEAEELSPDYDSTLSDVWTRTVKFILTSPSGCASPSLILALTGTQDCPKDFDQPSWVPGLSEITAESSRKSNVYVAQSPPNCTGVSLQNCAGGRLSFEVNLEDTRQGILWCTGRLLFRVQQTQQSSQYKPSSCEGLWPTTGDEYWQGVKTSLVPWYVKCHLFALRVAGGQDLEKARLQLLLKQGRTIEYPQDGPDFEDCQEVFKEALEAVSAAERTRIDLRQMHEDLNVFLSYDCGRWELDSTRTLASTTNGQLGWIPEQSRPDDIICIFKGAPFPFVVRARDDGYYTLIGDAYIEDIMQGEAWPDNEDEVGLIGIE